MEWSALKDFILVAAPFATLALGYRLGRPKQIAEVHKTNAEARRADAEVILFQTDKILALLDTIDKARASARADEDIIVELTRKLNNCLDDGQCKGKRMRELVETVLMFLADVESVLHTITENDELVKELRKLKKMLEKETV